MDIERPTALLGGLSPAAFMRRHWQKKPLLVRGALADPLPGFDRRAAVRAGGAGRRRVAAGRPRAASAGRCVPGRSRAARCRRWRRRAGPCWCRASTCTTTRRIALLQRFRFVPDARLDDVMVSYASDGGGVGPHVDSYDVFLLQVAGRRRWRIGRVARPRLRDDVPLKMLADFEADRGLAARAGRHALPAAGLGPRRHRRRRMPHRLDRLSRPGRRRPRGRRPAAAGRCRSRCARRRRRGGRAAIRSTPTGRSRRPARRRASPRRCSASPTAAMRRGHGRRPGPAAGARRSPERAQAGHLVRARRAGAARRRRSSSTGRAACSTTTPMSTSTARRSGPAAAMPH